MADVKRDRIIVVVDALRVEKARNTVLFRAFVLPSPLVRPFVAVISNPPVPRIYAALVAFPVPARISSSPPLSLISHFLPSHPVPPPPPCSAAPAVLPRRPYLICDTRRASAGVFSPD